MLGERRAIQGERKQVTVLFVDIARSMEMTRSLDTERWGVVLDRFLTIACGAIHDLEGATNQFTGDGLMAVFGAPLAHEDHARRACLAALRLHEKVAPFAEELARSDGVEFSIRCGLNSGEVIVVGAIGEDLRMDFAPIGNTSGLGKRLESLAPEGSTVLSASTASLVEGEFELGEMGEFEVKGLSEPQRAYELLGPGSAHTRLEAAGPARLSRFVGRDEERAALGAALDRALVGEGQAIGLRGEAGVGKSRLMREFVRDCHDRGLRVDSARALAHGRAVPLLPVLEMLRAIFEVTEDDEPTVARGRIEAALLDLDPSFEPDLPLLLGLLGLDDPERPAERIAPESRRRRLLGLAGRLVEARSRREPGVIVLEDLHWMDAASADFVEELARAVTGTRTLLVATFRPEYEGGWTDGLAYEELSLAPLDADASTALLESLLGGDPSLGSLAALIQSRTQGNPFFIEEIVQALAESGHLAGERGAYCIGGTLEKPLLPPTVQAVLGARIDRLGAREKELLRAMSVIGKEVDRAVLREVAGLEAPELASAISLLAAGEFVVEERVGGQRALAFKHPLTQEVAYASQLSEPRSRTHAAVAAAVEWIYPDGLDERAALLAQHSEAAGEHLKAARWHARAAAWVLVSSPAEGLRHWHRVRGLAGEAEGSPEAEQLATSACAAILTAAWRMGIPREEVAAIYAEGKGRLEASGPAAGRGRTETSYAGVLLDLAYAANVFTGDDEMAGFELLRKASSAAEAIGDPVLVLVAAVCHGMGAGVMGGFRECVEVSDRALALVGEDTATGSRLGVGNYYALCSAIRAVGEGSLGMFESAFRDLDRSLEVAADSGDPEAESFALASRALAYGDMLEPERGLPDAERAVELAERTGSNLALAITGTQLARLRSECDDFDGALEAAERAAAVNREHGAALPWEPDILCHMATAQLGLGEGDRACATAEEALAIAERRSLKRAIAIARLGLGRVLMGTEGAAGAGAAEEALNGALAMAAEIGYRALEPQVRRELAELARLRGDRAGAEREEAEAQRLLAEFGAPEASAIVSAD